VWEIDFSTIERLIFKGMDHLRQSFSFHFNTTGTDAVFPADGFFEFSVAAFASTTPVYYASGIAMTFGIVLIVCAIFATPWVSVKTIPQAFGRVGKGIKSAGKNLKSKGKKKGGK